jgi:hypothetical protein
MQVSVSWWQFQISSDYNMTLEFTLESVDLESHEENT